MMESTNKTTLAQLFDKTKVAASSHLSVVRDSTDAGDATALVLHIARSLASPKNPDSAPRKALLLTTKSRSSFVSGDSNHVFPAVPRSFANSTAFCAVLDPYTMQSPDFPVAERHFQAHITREAIEAGHRHGCHVIVIECLFSLQVVFGVNPSAFVRSVLGCGQGLSVMAACPTGCGVDNFIWDLADLADTVIDVRDLRTGVAADVDGVITVAKENGRWKPSRQAKRYRVTDTEFNLYT